MNDHDSRIAAAVADLDSQKNPNIRATAKEYRVSRTTLTNRWRGITGTRGEAASEYHKALTTTQEETLIRHIDLLTKKGYPPTTKTVRTIAESIRKEPVGKDWVSGFIQRYRDQLSSHFLGNIDIQRKKAEYPPIYQVFYNKVS